MMPAAPRGAGFNAMPRRWRTKEQPVRIRRFKTPSDVIRTVAQLIHDAENGDEEETCTMTEANRDNPDGCQNDHLSQAQLMAEAMERRRIIIGQEVVE